MLRDHRIIIYYLSHWAPKMSIRSILPVVLAVTIPFSTAEAEEVFNTDANPSVQLRTGEVFQQLEERGAFYSLSIRDAGLNVRSLPADFARDHWKHIGSIPTNAKQLSGTAGRFDAAQHSTASLLIFMLSKDEWSPLIDKEYLQLKTANSSAEELNHELAGLDPQLIALSGLDRQLLVPYKDERTGIDFLYREWETSTASYALHSNRRFLQLLVFPKVEEEPISLLGKVLNTSTVIQQIPDTPDFTVMLHYDGRMPDGFSEITFPLTAYSIGTENALVIVLDKERAMYPTRVLDLTSWFASEEQLEAWRLEEEQREAAKPTPSRRIPIGPRTPELQTTNELDRK